MLNNYYPFPLTDRLLTGIWYACCLNREQWLRERRRTIGGSDSACILGLNPYKSNTDFWNEKHEEWNTAPGDESLTDELADNPLVQYGNDAEEYLRALFALDNPRYKVWYKANNIFYNAQTPFAHYSADGMLLDDNGRLGILEIKTGNIMQSKQMDNWKDKIPENYYIQCLHGMMVTGAAFVVLKAQLKRYTENGEMYLITKQYKIDREEVCTDIQYLADQEEQFWDSIAKGKKPALILPQL